MAINIERFKKELTDLRHRGMLLTAAMIKETAGVAAMRQALQPADDAEIKEIERSLPHFNHAYEAWYSEAAAVIRQILPDRLDDFKRQYERAKARRTVDHATYVIEDYLIGLQTTLGDVVKTGVSAAIPKMQIQTAILASAEARFKSSLFEMRQLVQADLFDSEIASARELLKNGFLRAAGAVAGVVLEKHLGRVCDDHALKIANKNASIGDFNEALKAAGAIEIPQWRHISMLADIRNICDHSKKKEPNEAQVHDLIDGTDKILKTVS